MTFLHAVNLGTGGKALLPRGAEGLWSSTCPRPYQTIHICSGLHSPPPHQKECEIWSASGTGSWGVRRKNGSGCESLASQGGVRGHAEWLWRSVTFLEDLCPPITVVLKTLGNLICLSFMCISPLRQVVSAVLFRLQSFDGVYLISYLFPPPLSACALLGLRRWFSV